MIFSEAGLPGVWIIEPEPVRDLRGSFARIFCAASFAEHGLETGFDQVSWSRNSRAGTLRGLHIQRPPHGEVKLIRATAGVVFDVLVDMRRDSPCFGQWISVELSVDCGRLLYVPKGIAHGFQTLVDNSELTYHICGQFVPEAEDGVTWNDPQLAIEWPLPENPIISNRDISLAKLSAFVPV